MDLQDVYNNDETDNVVEERYVADNNDDITEEDKQKHVNKFVESVKEYVDLDDQLKAAQKDIQLLKSRKQNLTLAIMGFMQSQEWDVCNISTGGKLMMKKSKTKSSVKKDTTNLKLIEHFKNNQDMLPHIPEIMKMIFEEREITEKDVLRRTTTRK